MQIRFFAHFYQIVFFAISPPTSLFLSFSPVEPVVKVHLVFFLDAAWVLFNFSSGGVVHRETDFGGMQLIGSAEQSRILTEERRWRQISFVAFPPIYEVSARFKPGKKFWPQLSVNSEKKGVKESYIYIYIYIRIIIATDSQVIRICLIKCQFVNIDEFLSVPIYSLFARFYCICVNTLTFACCKVDFLFACVRAQRMDVYFQGVSRCTFGLEILHARHIRMFLKGSLMSHRSFALCRSKR